VIEIGCVELVDSMPTGRTYHTYINPQRDVPPDAFRVHGLSYEFLKSKPTFKRIINKFLDFIGDATLVAHNAKFDIDMIDAELKRIEQPPLNNDVVDTLELAREKKRTGRHSLDALLSFFKIDGSKRDKHGALLDASLLAEVYIELRGGRQKRLALEVEQDDAEDIFVPAKQRPVQLVRSVSVEDIVAHRAFIAELKEPIWAEYLMEGEVA
jgi:DNA polymerase-3 subunit epsilon